MSVFIEIKTYSEAIVFFGRHLYFWFIGYRVVPTKMMGRIHNELSFVQGRKNIIHVCTIKSNSK